MSKHSEGTRLRGLTLNACKREKCKFDILKHDIDTFRDKYAAITGKEFPVIDPATYETLKNSSNSRWNNNFEHVWLTECLLKKLEKE